MNTHYYGSVGFECLLSFHFHYIEDSHCFFYMFSRNLGQHFCRNQPNPTSNVLTQISFFSEVSHHGCEIFQPGGYWFFLLFFFSPMSLAGTCLGSRHCEVGNILVRKKLQTIKAVTWQARWLMLYIRWWNKIYGCIVSLITVTQFFSACGWN